MLSLGSLLEREGQKIAVEIKSFISPSNVSEFHTDLGQFLNHQSITLCRLAGK